jgi:PAS domain S-box-containing protein
MLAAPSDTIPCSAAAGLALPRRRLLVLSAAFPLAVASAARAQPPQPPQPDRLAGQLQIVADAVDAELRRIEAALVTATTFIDAGPPGRASAGPQASGASLAAIDRAARGAAATLDLPVIGLDARLAQVVNSAIPFGTPLPASPAADLAADAFGALRPVAGFVGVPGSAPNPAIAVPASGPAGQPQAVLVGFLPRERLTAILTAALDSVESTRFTSIRLERVGVGAPQLLAELRRTAESEHEGSLVTATRGLRRLPGAALTVTTIAEPAPAAPARSPATASQTSVWPLLVAGLLGLLGGALLAPRRRQRRAMPEPIDLESRQALAELRAIADTVPVGLALLDGNGTLLSANKRLAAFAGLPEDALPGRNAAAVLPPAIAEALEAAHAQVLRTGRPVLDVAIAVDASGTLRHTRHLVLSCHPVRDERRRVESVSLAIEDVTERMRAEHGRNLLVRELNHRVKNCLATVQTIAGQTLRSAGSLEAFGRSFGERIRALARAHDLLTVHAWGEADLLSVTRAALGPWLDDPRMSIESGPPVTLRPGQAQALVLAFSELATNAAKHGALTREDGRVRLRWWLDAEGWLNLSWSESGGPVVEPPSHAGFGTRLLEQALRHDLGSGASSDLAFEPSGLRASVRFRPAAVALQQVEAA